MARTCKVLMALGLLVLSSCSSDDDPPASGRLELVRCGASGEITVAAAASLTEAFTEIGEAVEADCEGSEITFTFDSSGKLSEQIRSGAPVDVFAAADEASAARVAELAAGDAEVVARNRLAIVTKPGNPEGIETLADLADVGVVALCAEDAPCGRFAAEALEAAGAAIDESTVTRGQNARATLTAVREGDAVAGIVYVTDAAAAGDGVETVDIPDDQNVLATYPVVAIDGPGDDGLAAAFVAYLQSDEAQAVLAEAGFLPPS